jgi:alpha-tubulin suppressor-like RCC1 family protein
MLSCGRRTLAVITNDMSLRACGDNTAGQLGIKRKESVPFLSSVSWPGRREVQIKMVSGSENFIAAVDETGQVWASCSFPRKPSHAGSMSILETVWPPTRVIFVATGAQHCMALTEDMCVLAAGKNWSGQLGTGDTVGRHKLCPVYHGPTTGTSTMVACGSYFSVILSQDGSVRTCGQYSSLCLCKQSLLDDNNPALFDFNNLDVDDNNLGACVDILEPTLTATFSPDKVEYIAAGTSHVVAIAAGALYTWGQNSSGQLGVGTFEDQRLPVRIGGEDVFGSPVRIAVANEHHTLVLTEKRVLYGFGNAAHGRIGLPRPFPGANLAAYVLSPMQVSMENFGKRRVSTISAGKGHSAALTEDGRVYTWGQASTNEYSGTVPSALAQPAIMHYQAVPLLVPYRLF